VRKALLSRFNAFVRRLPIEYHTFSYSSYDVGGVKELSARMRRDLVNFVYEHFEGFRSFDRVVIYYDDGQQAVTKALHEAFDFMLGDGAVEYRRLRYQDRRLSQVADYLSSVELAAMRYAEGSESSTYRIMTSWMSTSSIRARGIARSRSSGLRTTPAPAATE
jgi:hypothetical protein